MKEAAQLGFDFGGWAPAPSAVAREPQRALAAQGAPPRLTRTAGLHHDLAELFAEVNARYFEGRVDAAVSWGRRAPRRRRRRGSWSINLGTYCAEQKLVRIHPMLDQPEVPRFFVEYILFHEMLHHVVPMPVTHGRRQTHTPEFRAQERRFLEYERAVEWEKLSLPRLVNR
jgi:hypothetical protein